MFLNSSILFLVILCLSHPCLSKGDGIRKANLDEDGEFHQGDMRIAPGVLESVRGGIIGEQFRWPNNQVVYWLDPGWTVEELNIIQGAFEEISQKTCITFVQRVDQIDYVNMTREMSGCWSYVGKIGNRQQLNLQPGTPGCISHGIAVHELLHVIGFFHEHTRSDRDDYVTINWSNIAPADQSNFAIQHNSEGYGLSYDYGSLMHYSAYDFAINPNEPTIIPIHVELDEIGQRTGMSESDVAGVNLMYNCPQKKSF